MKLKVNFNPKDNSEEMVELQFSLFYTPNQVEDFLDKIQKTIDRDKEIKRIMEETEVSEIHFNEKKKRKGKKLTAFDIIKKVIEKDKINIENRQDEDLPF